MASRSTRETDLRSRPLLLVRQPIYELAVYETVDRPGFLESAVRTRLGGRTTHLKGCALSLKTPPDATSGSLGVPRGSVLRGGS